MKSLLYQKMWVIERFHERVQDKLDEWIYFLKHGEIKQEFSAKASRAQQKN